MFLKLFYFYFVVFFLRWSPFAFASCKAGDENDIARVIEKKSYTKLVFFSTWCADCKDELVRVKKDIKNKDNYILINTFYSSKKTDEVLKEFGLEKHLCFLDKDKKIREKFKVTTVPKIILISN